MTIPRLISAAALISALILGWVGPGLAQATSEKPSVDDAQAVVDRLQPIWQEADQPDRTRMALELIKALRVTARHADVLALLARIGPDQTSPDQEDQLLMAAMGAASALRSVEGEAAIAPRVAALSGKDISATKRVTLWDKLASTQVHLGRFPQAEETARRGLALAGSAPSKAEFALRKTLAVAQVQQGKIAEAIESMLAAEKVAIAADEPLDIAFLKNFGGMLIYAKDLPRAIQYLERAERAAGATGGDSAELASIYSNLGIAHHGLEQLDEAQRYYEKAIEVARSRKESPANALNNLAGVLMERGQVTDAKRRFEEVLAMRRANGDRVNEAVALRNLGEALVNIGQREQAADLFEQAHALQIEFDNRPKRLELLPIMTDNLEALGRHAAALAILREFKTLNDEANNADAQERIGSLQGAIDLAERDRELAASEVERARQEASIAALQSAEQRQRWLAYGLAFGVAGLTLVLSVLVRQNRFRARANRALAEKNREIQSQQENLQALNQKVIEQSLRDELTQLPNRRFLNEYMHGRSAAALSPPSPTLLLLIDIDRFKQLNDSHGHLVGDQALVHIAGVLRSVERESDVMARWGGEEFLWLCPGLGVEMAASLCARVRRALSDHPLVLADKSLPMTVSIGVAPLPLWPGRKGDWAMSLRAADAALYMAKNEGRDRWAGLAGAQQAGLEPSDEAVIQALIESRLLVRL